MTKAQFEQKRRAFCSKKAIGGVVLLSIALLSTITYAEVAPKIKFYGKNAEFDYDLLDKYDMKGLKYILVYPDGYSSAWLGYYYPNQIRLYSSEEWVFVHELAHHYDYLETGNYQGHSDNFYEKQEEIWQSV